MSGSRLLIDQCVSRRLVRIAFEPIAEVAYISDIASGADDEVVLSYARRDGQILVTEDYDFGDMIFAQGALPPSGIIHLALAGMAKGVREAKLVSEAKTIIAAAPGRFVVFSKGPIRSRALPAR